MQFFMQPIAVDLAHGTMLITMHYWILSQAYGTTAHPRATTGGEWMRDDEAIAPQVRDLDGVCESEGWVVAGQRYLSSSCCVLLVSCILALGGQMMMRRELVSVMAMGWTCKLKHSTNR